jgi:MoaA/NifB/PqqE/SkfB family radical SAM enzyme
MFLDAAQNLLWDPVTLERFELNDDAVSILTEVLRGDSTVSAAERRELDEQLSMLAININDIHLWSTQTPIIRTPIIHIIRNCNSPCVMCDCWLTKGRQRMPLKDITRLFAVFRSLGASTVMISGGEPTLHPDILEIVDAAHDHHLGVELNSNAIQLARLQDGLTARRIEALVVSMDGTNAQDYKTVRGVDRFDRVCTNVREFARLNPWTTVGLRTTVTKFSLYDLGSLCRLANDLGVKAVGFNPLDIDSDSFQREMSVARSQHLAEMLLPTLDELAAMISELRDRDSQMARTIRHAYQTGLFDWDVNRFIECLSFYAMKLGAKASFGDMTQPFASNEPCMFPRLSLVVDYDSSIRPCFYGPVLSQAANFSPDRFDLAAAMDVMRDEGICVGCRGKLFCGI